MDNLHRRLGGHRISACSTLLQVECLQLSSCMPLAPWAFGIIYNVCVCVCVRACACDSQMRNASAASQVACVACVKLEGRAWFAALGLLSMQCASRAGRGIGGSSSSSRGHEVSG